MTDLQPKAAMAINEYVPGIEAVIIVDGQPLKEYQDDDEEEQVNETIRYVEAAAGKTFSIQVKKPKNFPFKYDFLAYHFWVDGEFSGAAVSITMDEQISVSQGVVDNDRIHKYCFLSLETGECDQRPMGLALIDNSIGRPFFPWGSPKHQKSRRN